MKRAWLCVTLLASFSFAQSSRKLADDVASLKGATIDEASRKLATDMLSLADPNAPPSRRAITEFTDALTQALIRKPRGASASQLSTAIVDVLHSNGVPTCQYYAAFDRAEDALLAMRVPDDEAKQILDKLRVIAQQIHGPEDLPLDAPPRAK